jgi:hypothetical protein
MVGRFAAMVAVPTLFFVGGCASNEVLSSSNPSRAAPRHWQDYDQLPVVMLGSITGKTQSELASLFPSAPGAASGRHIVMYVNAEQLPSKPDLCSDPGSFRSGSQTGDAANVTGALCDGSREITRATGTVLTTDQSPRWLVKGFDQIRNQLYQSLYPNTNDPFKWRLN